MGKNILPYCLSTEAYLQWLAIVVDDTLFVFFNPMRRQKYVDAKRLP